MTDNKARIDRLNVIIDSLDAEADHLQNTIRAATIQLEAAVQLGTDASKAAAVVSTKALEKIDDMTTKTDTFLREQSERCEAFYETLDDFIATESESNASLLEAQEEFQRATLKNDEIFRDKVQTSLLQSKNDLASHVQSLSADFSLKISTLDKRVASLEDSFSTSSRQLKIIFTGTIAVVLLEVIILVATMAY